MDIKEVLKSYYAPAGHTIQQSIQNKRLAADFANWATTDKTLNWMNKMLTKYNQTEIHPDRLITEILNPFFLSLRAMITMTL